jgi:hypothetical protein
MEFKYLHMRGSVHVNTLLSNLSFVVTAAMENVNGME